MGRFCIVKWWGGGGGGYYVRKIVENVIFVVWIMIEPMGDNPIGDGYKIFVCTRPLFENVSR